MTDDNQSSGTIDPRRAWAVLWSRRVLILLCLVVAGGCAFVYSATRQKQYTASASLLFRDARLDQTLFGSTYFTNEDPTRDAATNAKLVSLEVVAARTSRALHNGMTPSQIQSAVTIEQQGQANVVSIKATDPNPTLAARIPNEFARQYIAFRRDADRAKVHDAQLLVQHQLDGLSPEKRRSGQGRSLQQRAEQLQILASLQTGNAELVQPAARPGSPSSPTPKRDAILGGLLGLILGVGLAFLLERLDRRLKDPQEIAAAFDRPILGAVPESRAIASGGRSVRELAPGEAEAFRMLRANLRYFNVDREIHSVLITSSAPADGKSTVAMHLASAAAATGSRVVLIEADLRHPTLARRLGLSVGAGGLSQVLAGEIDGIAQVLHEVPTGTNGRTLDVVTSGPIPPNPSDLIESERMRDLIRSAETDYDLVVIDTPPTSVVSDAIPLVKEVSGVIVVCRLGKTTRESAAHLRSQLEHLEANTLGVVINSVGRQTGYYGYGYGYGYGDAEQKREAQQRDVPDPRPAPAPEPEPSARPTEIPAAAQPRVPARNGSPGGANGHAPAATQKGLLRRRRARD
jgi:succinoglycan biosynthesis transport protein ExoP